MTLSLRRRIPTKPFGRFSRSTSPVSHRDSRAAASLTSSGHSSMIRSQSFLSSLAILRLS